MNAAAMFALLDYAADGTAQSGQQVPQPAGQIAPRMFDAGLSSDGPAGVPPAPAGQRGERGGARASMTLNVQRLLSQKTGSHENLTFGR